MQKKILVVYSVLSLLVAAPAIASTMVMEMGLGVAEQVDQERQISINMEGNSVTVTGASGMTLEIVSITGRHVATYKIEGPAQRIELNLLKGCYILKVGKVVRKVTLR